MIFVDTNYFLRFLLNDQNHQHQEAKALFQQAAQGKKQLFTSIVVFFEIYWVLSSFYQKKKTELIEKLVGVLSMDFVQFQEKALLEQSINIFENTNLDLEDAYNLVYASAHGASELKTFDKKLGRIFSG